MRQGGFKYVPGLEGLKTNLAFIPNDTLKGDFILDNASRYKNYTDYKTLMDAYGKYVVTPSQKKRSVDIVTPLLTLKTGEEAYAFSYPDKEGKTVTMASLKGKVILVDVWATWCGPCKAEIPHLKKLEEEMNGKNVQIISLSTDAVTDKGKWLKMIQDEKLGGMQLFAGGPGNEFSQYYKVNTIPRFLVFDKQGKIVTVDSPRPSNPELKALLEKELAK
jgi:thiol-disulfide isomerase/thioredoxin